MIYILVISVSNRRLSVDMNKKRRKSINSRNKQTNKMVKRMLARTSCRNFKDEDISDKQFNTILEAGRLSPSTANMQTWKFIVFNRRSWKEKFNAEIPFNGPRAIIICADLYRYRKMIKEKFPSVPLTLYTISIINASMAAMNMWNVCTALGLAGIILSDTGKTGFFEPLWLKEKLNLPSMVFPVCTFVMGIPLHKKRFKAPRLPFKAVVNKGEFRNIDKKTMGKLLHRMEDYYEEGVLFLSFKEKLGYYREAFPKIEKELHKLIFEK